jgi:hypothetical protein
MKNQWIVGNDTIQGRKSSRTVWCLYRKHFISTEYYRTDTGRLRTWKSEEAAKKFCEHLNRFPLQ